MAIKGVPQRATIAATASGNTAVVAAVSGQVIRVLSGIVTSDSSVNIKFQSNTSDISGVHYVSSRGGFSIDYNPMGLIETAAGEARNINLSAGSVNVGGEISYVQGEL